MTASAAALLRVVNLDPFHLAYGVPGSYGACVLQPGSSEAIAALDIASHMKGARSGSERLFVDGETWRQALALRHGLGDGWEALLELSVVSHVPGVFDGFIETWHEFFHLPQGGRDTAPRDRLAIRYDKGSAGCRRDRGGYLARRHRPRGGPRGEAEFPGESRSGDPRRGQACRPATTTRSPAPAACRPQSGPRPRGGCSAPATGSTARRSEPSPRARRTRWGPAGLSPSAGLA